MEAIITHKVQNFTKDNLKMKVAQTIRTTGQNNRQNPLKVLDSHCFVFTCPGFEIMYWNRVLLWPPKLNSIHLRQKSPDYKTPKTTCTERRDRRGQWWSLWFGQIEPIKLLCPQSIHSPLLYISTALAPTESCHIHQLAALSFSSLTEILLFPH